jgi:hypothetical protein
MRIENITKITMVNAQTWSFCRRGDVCAGATSVNIRKDAPSRPSEKA